MRLLVCLLLISVFGVCSGAVQEFMNLEIAQKRWGQKPFSAELFKAGTPKDRASMAYSLIQGKTFIGKSAKEVKTMLGPTSGYFWSKRIPTYFIEEGWDKNQDSWQLVFLIDEQDRVTEVKIHKNCCDN
jgi:hypothetical protein